MRKLQTFYIGIILIFFLSCRSSSKEILIDNFEGEISPQSVDFGSSQGSSVKVSSDNNLKVCGEQALKITYELKPSGYMWVARGYNLDVKGAAQWEVKPEDIAWEEYNALSIYMYGANSGSVVALDIKDRGGEFWRFLLDDDFEGWKEIVCPFDEFFVRRDWQPDTAVRNETLDFPVMSFQFEPRMPGKGTYYFDCVKLIKQR